MENNVLGNPKQMVVTIPLKLLHEAQGLVVTVEMKNGEMCRGCIKEVDDYMNVILENVSVTNDSGGFKSAELLIRGSNVGFFVFPPALKFAPFFDKKPLV